MKKTIYSLFVVSAALFLAGCADLDDINNAIDEAQEKQAEIDQYFAAREIAPEAYTLTDDDYELSSNDAVATYKNFSASALPAEYLPEILNKKFVGEDAQEMLVTYDFYERVVADEEGAYELTDEDYDDMGMRYGNFDDYDEAEVKIARLLDKMYYYDVVEEGTETTVKYLFYSSGDTRYLAVVAADSAVALDDEPDDAFEFTDYHYDTYGGSRYGNYDYLDGALDGVIQHAADTGWTSYPVYYAVDVYRNYYDKYMVFRYGASWAVATSVSAVAEPLNFALVEENIEESTWWADPAIKITLTKADYDMFETTSNYQNFDLRSGQTPGTDEQLRAEMIGEMLEANHGPVSDDQQYLVTYKYYDGSSGVGTDRIIRTNGEWSQYVAE